MSLARRIAPLGWLAALALAYFASLVVHPSRTLYADHSDLIALHVPWETFLARSWRETGERPLWNPLQFAGLPFAHDVQAAISYPPHQIFQAIDTQESAIGAALSWLIVGHVVLAGWGMYAYARTTGLGPTAAFISAIGFMFAGKWLLHLTLAGHYAFIGLAPGPLSDFTQPSATAPPSPQPGPGSPSACSPSQPTHSLRSIQDSFWRSGRFLPFSPLDARQTLSRTERLRPSAAKPGPRASGSPTGRFLAF
jgi:hypothetical protein